MALARHGARRTLGAGVVVIANVLNLACGRSPLTAGPREESAGAGMVAAAGLDAGAPVNTGGRAQAGSGGAGAGAGGVANVGGQGGAGAGSGDSWQDPPDSTTTAAAYQVDAAHTGAQPLDTLRVPLLERWSHDFGTSELTYPIIASGRVHIIAGGELFALDLADGEVLWGNQRAGSTASACHAAYERGRLFTVCDRGEVRALATESGQELWSVVVTEQFSGPFWKSIPVVYAGYLYVAGDDKLFAIDGANGVVRWTIPTESCWTSGAAVSQDGAFVACLCDHVYGADSRTGAHPWAYPGGCTGGGGGVSVLNAFGFVYTRDGEGNLVLDALTGELVGTHAAGPIPAAAGDMLYSVNDGVLFAHRAGDGEPVFTFGDGHLTIAPLVVGKHVVAGSAEGHLYLLDSLTGRVVGETSLASPLPLPDEDTVEGPLTGLNAAENRLAVPNGSVLRVF